MSLALIWQGAVLDVMVVEENFCQKLSLILWAFTF
jgi:hypothetical protein